MRRRDVLAGGAAMAGTTLAPSVAVAQASDFPNRPITLIVPWPAGGPADIVLRAMADVAGRELGQPIICDNKAGASGTLGPATMAATAKPDGYTLSQIAVTVHRLPMMQKTTWDPLRDFTYVMHVSGFTLGIAALADGPLKSWADLVAYAKANPGKVTFGTPGARTSQHIGMEEVAALAGIQLTHVPFKGSAEASAAVLGGHVMLQVDSSVWSPHVSSGAMRLLAIWTENRSARWPDAPTLHDLGLGRTFDSPFGIAGPKGITPAITAKLHDAFMKALETPSVIEVLTKYDMTPRYMDPERYAQFVGEYIAQERKTLERLGLLKTD